jgi:hypothetical protein
MGGKVVPQAHRWETRPTPIHQPQQPRVSAQRHRSAATDCATLLTFKGGCKACDFLSLLAHNLQQGVGEPEEASHVTGRQILKEQQNAKTNTVKAHSETQKGGVAAPVQGKGEVPGGSYELQQAAGAACQAHSA